VRRPREFSQLTAKSQRHGAGSRNQTRAKRLECARLAAAFGAPHGIDSGSKLTALQTLRDEKGIFAKSIDYPQLHCDDCRATDIGFYLRSSRLCGFLEIKVVAVRLR
jgi:hypothetical protein